MNKALNDSTDRRGPQTHTHTHTQKKMDPVGLYSVELGRGTFPPHAVTPTPNHHGGTRTHDPQTRPSHHDRRRSQSPPRRQTKPIATKTAHHSTYSSAFLASHWLGRACDARPWLIGQRKHSMPFFGAGLRSEAMEAPPTSVLGTHCVRKADGGRSEGGMLLLMYKNLTLK